MAMTPSRKPQRGDSPQRFTPRASSKMPGQVRRALDGQILSSQRNGRTLEVATDGRLEVKAAPGGGIKISKQGLMVDPVDIGEKNRPPIERQSDLASGSTAAQIVTAFNALLSELRRTGNMRG